MRKLGCIFLWISYTVVIMGILPFYLIMYPIDWVLCKQSDLWAPAHRKGKRKPSTWWWDLGDYLEENVLPV